MSVKGVAHRGMVAYNSALKQGFLDDGFQSFRVLHAKFHGILVVVDCIIDTAHHTLIVTEEEDGQAGNAVDSNEKLPLLQLVHHIPLGNSIHSSRLKDMR